MLPSIVSTPMGDLGATRLIARAALRETGASRSVRAYVGTHYHRDHFTGAENTLLTAHTPDEGNAYEAVGSVPVLRINNANQVKFPAGDNSAIATNVGVTEAFAGGILIFSAVPEAGPKLMLGFRLGDPAAGSVSETGFSSGWSVVGERVDTAIKIRLYRDGVVKATSTDQSLPAAGAHWPIEFRFYGSPLTCHIWLDGTRILNFTDTEADPYVANTHLGVARFVPESLRSTDVSNTLVDDVFVADVPTSPNASDADVYKDDLTLAAFAAGANVPIKVRWAKHGTPTSAVSENVYVDLQTDNATGTNLGTQATIATSGADYGYGEVTNKYATADATSTGAARSGMFKMRVRQQVVDSLVTDWKIDSSNADVLLPAGTSHDYAAGYFVATTTVASVTDPADGQAYGDSVTASLTVGAQPLRSFTHSSAMTFRQGGTAVHTSNASNSTTTYSMATADTVDNAYAASPSGVQFKFQSANGSVGTSEPYHVFTSAPAGYELTGTLNSAVQSTGDTAFTADPRITVDHHMQKGGSTFDASRDVTSRLPSDLGKVTFTLTNANASPLSGLTVTETLTDSAGDVDAAINRSVTTDADGRAALASWDSQVPGGIWNHTVDVTSPAGATGLEVTPTAEFTLLASSPSIKVVAEGGPTTANRALHFDGTGTFQAFVGVIDVDTQMVLSSTTTPAVSEAKVALFRVNSSGVAQYLNASNVWTNMTAGVAIDFHTATETASGTGVYVKSFTADSTWGTSDVVCFGRAVVNSTPYGGVGKEIVVGHTGEAAFDAVAFSALGVPTFM